MLRADVQRAAQFQIEACRNIGSPFYAALLTAALEEANEEHPAWALLEEWQGDAFADLVVLRLLGAIHELVLSGKAPELEPHFPSTHGDEDGLAAWKAMATVVEREHQHIRSRLKAQVQTNEVLRCAVLLPGFLEVARKTRLPYRLLEVGSSAGLNLCWDHYQYRMGSYTWGRPSSRLVLKADYDGPPLEPSAVQVASRLGCDISPLNLGSQQDRQRLRGFVWPDQHERFALLDAALQSAAPLAPQIVQQTAADFVADQTAQLPRGVVTVVFHSIVWLYLSVEERRRIESQLAHAGGQATDENPLAWLRMEFANERLGELHLDYWPGGSHDKLADCHYHGKSIHWCR